jgi:ketosteroid isomerase-like protein
MSDAAVRAEIETALLRGGEAWARGDVAAMEALLSPTFSHVDIKAKLTDRTAWLAYLKTRAGSTTKTTMEDVAIRVFGDVAIVTARQVNAELGGDDKGPRAFRIMTVMIKHDGAWLREAVQVTEVSE